MEGKAGSLASWPCEEEHGALSLQDRVSRMKEARVLGTVVWDISVKRAAFWYCTPNLNQVFVRDASAVRPVVFSRWGLRLNAASLICFNWQLGKIPKYLMTFYSISEIGGCFFQEFTWNDISKVHVTVDQTKWQKNVEYFPEMLSVLWNILCLQSCANAVIFNTG